MVHAESGMSEQSFKVRPFSKRGSVVLTDAADRHVGIVNEDVAHLLAAAPMLLGMVEALLPYARGSGLDARVVGEAETMLAFLHRQRIPCGDCDREGKPCLACGGLGVRVAGLEKA